MKKIFSASLLRLAILILVGATALFTAACKKDEKSDDEIIQKYLSDNGITNAQKQSSGLYYVPGTTNPSGTQARATTTVSVLYTGYLMDGTVFDATSRRNNMPFDFVLGRGQVIGGWDEGIALMRKGEKGTLLIPSSLGYGSRGQGSIPANSVLRFEVELVNVR